MAVDRKQQMKEITERLEQGVKDIFTSEMYMTYLRTMAKFHNYSFNNTLLIAMQRPDATLVAGFNAWKNKFNRYVKKGEKGIQIIAPAPIKEVEEREKIDKDTGLAVLNENGEPEMERVEYVVPRFRVTTVFDVSQTDGEPIPSLEVNELTASVKDYALLTATIEQVSPVPIRFDEILVEKTVVVNHAASVLMAEELDLGAEGRLELGEEGLNFTGAELTVREFMEEQQQKSNALIHGDSYHIAVEGHIGTWYAIDETEIGGEKFFLLEHEEHGDMAACVAVNEQGKLVAEDLWNGFDEDFQEAMQKYLSEKWNMPKKEDVVSEIIEKAAPVPDNSAQDYSDVPVYYEPFGYAKENDEVDLYRTSYRLNSECKQAIHEAIADNYDGMYLGDGAVDQVVRQYGMERVGYILANTLHHKSYDGRFSHGNKEWAEQVSTPEHNADRMTFRTDWVVDSHPAILDGFVTMYRDELEAQKRQEQPFVKQFYVVENLQAAPLKIERFGNLDDAMAQYQALPNHYMKALGVEKNPDPLPGSLDILQCRNGIDTIVEDYKTVPGWDNPYIQNHVVQPLQGALAVQDVELAYELPDAYFHIQTCDDGFDYTLYNKDFTERDGGVLETDGDKPVQEAMTELLAEFGCDAAECKVMDAAELREQADTVAEQQAEVLKEKLTAERPAPEETLSFYVAECLEFTFAGEFHDHLTMEEALEAYDKIPSERMNADKCIGFCIEEDGGFVGMYELVVNDKVQRENINSINYFRDDKLVQNAISDMEKLMEARQKSKEQERSSTKKSVLDALRSLKAKKQEQPAQEQDKPKKAKKKGMEL